MNDILLSNIYVLQGPDPLAATGEYLNKIREEETPGHISSLAGGGGRGARRDMSAGGGGDATIVHSANILLSEHYHSSGYNTRFFPREWPIFKVWAKLESIELFIEDQG